MTALSDRLTPQWMGTTAPQGRSMDNPLPTLDWPDDNPPPSWWGIGPSGLTKVYRSYKDYCDD